VNDTVNQAARTATDAVDTTARTTDAAVTTSVNTVNNAPSIAVNAADSTVNKAATLAGGVERAATTKVHAVEKSVLDVVSSVKDLAGHGWTLNLSVLGTSARSGGNMLTPTGTVSIVDSNGRTIASSSLANGACTLHLGAIGQHNNLTINYSGDAHFAQTALKWIVPTI
jgi:hypothetical protein